MVCVDRIELQGCKGEECGSLSASPRRRTTRGVKSAGCWAEGAYLETGLVQALGSHTRRKVEWAFYKTGP
jgi:hypothetical protein